MTQASVWQQASVVLQENHFFFGTVRENLALAGDFSDTEMEAALASVRLGFALDEPVLEKGANLSGGERTTSRHRPCPVEERSALDS
nr:hypothetical protein [Bacillus sp. P14.5]